MLMELYRLELFLVMPEDIQVIMMATTKTMEMIVRQLVIGTMEVL